jgi:chromate transporter
MFLIFENLWNLKSLFTGVAMDLKSKGVIVPSHMEAVKVWLKIGLLSFGGPAGQIAMMHRTLVEEKKWINESRFLHALNYCMLLPGPEAQQLATYIGWLIHRTAGGLIAGLLFILPGALVMLGLSLIYVLYSQLPLVNAAFLGIKAAILIVVVEAVIRIGKRAITSSMMLAVSIISFIAIFFFAVPFPIIIAGAAIAGFTAGIVRPRYFNRVNEEVCNLDKKDSLIERMEAAGQVEHTHPSLIKASLLISIFLILWLVPIIFLLVLTEQGNVFAQQSLFFSKLAVVTFGGAYAVLAYMAQQAVEIFGWLSAQEMLDGLGLAETTPGPLILVTQFVGFLSAYRFAEGMDPIVAGIIGSGVTLWVTFVPCFLWIFLGAPYIEKLRKNLHIAAALSGITAAVVGVVLNLAVWFGLHVSFSEIHYSSFFYMLLPVPILESANGVSIGLTAFAVVLLLFLKQGVFRTLCACAGCSFLIVFFN